MTDPTQSKLDPLDAFHPLKSGPEHILRIISKVLTLEQERLYLKAPHLNDDVLRVIKEEVK
jgi:hypothetical protein